MRGHAIHCGYVSVFTCNAEIRLTRDIHLGIVVIIVLRVILGISCLTMQNKKTYTQKKYKALIRDLNAVKVPST